MYTVYAQFYFPNQECVKLGIKSRKKLEWLQYWLIDCFFVWQPSGLLLYLDSDAEVPTHEDDKLHVRDNVKLAQVCQYSLSVLFTADSETLNDTKHFAHELLCEESKPWQHVCSHILQDIQNRNRRNPNLVMIEKKVDELLQHWRARIGLEKNKQVGLFWPYLPFGQTVEWTATSCLLNSNAYLNIYLHKVVFLTFMYILTCFS